MMSFGLPWVPRLELEQSSRLAKFLPSVPCMPHRRGLLTVSCARCPAKLAQTTADRMGPCSWRESRTRGRGQAERVPALSSFSGVNFEWRPQEAICVMIFWRQRRAPMVKISMWGSLVWDLWECTWKFQLRLNEQGAEGKSKTRAKHKIVCPGH